MSAMSATLERAAAASATQLPAQGSRPAQVYGWRFPAEFRTRPVGWTERKRKEAAAPPQESSLGGEVARDPVLDQGPESEAAASVLRAPDASNAPAAAPMAALAFGASPGTACLAIEEAAPQALILDIGKLHPGPPAGAQEAHERQSNAGPTLLLRDLGMVPDLACRKAEVPGDVLAIGEVSAWPSRSRNDAASFNEASYARS